MNEVIDAAQRSRGLKKGAGEGLQLVGPSCRTEVHCIRRDEQAEMRMSVDSSVTGLRNAGLGSHDVSGKSRACSLLC